MDEIKKISQSNFHDTVLENLLNVPKEDTAKNIYLKGTIPNFEKYKFISVVGSRSHSPYAARALEKIISELSGYDIVIVSGLALGIDTLAHKYAIKYRLPTIAVPGSGLNDKVLYPKSNFKLSKDILSNGGCLISEYEPNFSATSWSFPKRNRIMAALSDLTLVIEAGEKSGTLITARIANEYGKDVCVIPSSIFNENSVGSNNLLKQGAFPIFSGKDILNILKIEEKENLKEMINLDDLTTEEKIIYQNLREPIYKSDLIDKLSERLTVQKISETLSLMEIKGLVKESLNKIYRN